MFEVENINGGIWEIDFFENIGFVLMWEVDDITVGIGEPKFFENLGFV